MATQTAPGTGAGGTPIDPILDEVESEVAVAAVAAFPFTSKTVVFQEDFLSANGIGRFTVTQNDGTGSGTGAASANANQHGGVHELTTNTSGAVVGEWHQMQSEVEGYNLGLGRTLSFVCRFRMLRSATGGLFIGLAVTSATLLGVSSTGTANKVQDWIGFQVKPNSGQLSFGWGINAGSTSEDVLYQDLADMDDEWHEVAFAVNMDHIVAGKGTVTAYLDGEMLDLGGDNMEAADVTTLPYDEDLCVSLGVCNGSTNMQRAQVDCFEVVLTRIPRMTSNL